MTNARMWIAALAGGLVLPALAVGKEAVPAKVTLADYQRAEAMLPANLAPKLLNAKVEPVWLPDGQRFWYRRQTATGSSFVAVDPAQRSKVPAFDHAALAAAIAGVTGKPADPNRLALAGLRFEGTAGTEFSFETEGLRLRCQLAGLTCKGEPAVAADPQRAVSPDGRLAILARDHNLWLRDVATRQERQLTTNGEERFAWGRTPDANLLRVNEVTKGVRTPLYGVNWSPDSRHVVVRRSDERGGTDYLMLQSLPYDGDRRPKPVTARVPLTGEPAYPIEVSVIDTTTGTSRPVNIGAEGFSTPFWQPDGARFLALQGGRYARTATLFEVTTATGAVRQILREESTTFLQTAPLHYDEQAVRFLPASNEVIWYSQRDGWNQLYLVDVATGAIKSKITAGDWNIQNIIRVDEKARRVWFTGTGREKGQNPYWRHLYSASLDGGEPTLLTPEPGDHAFAGAWFPQYAAFFSARGSRTEISPSGDLFIDSRSTVETPPVTVLRRGDGSLVMPLETADVSAARAAGWIAPKPFQVKAADGTTDLYGIVFQPAGFDPKKRYPVIDAIYNGPQIVSTPHDFSGAMVGPGAHAQAFAQLGFVVVMLDSRGTPMRSKKFQDYIYNNVQEFGLEDHVAAIRNLAAKAPYVDLGRVGIFGHSFGGYSALKGILGYPDFFHAASASAGPYDMNGMYWVDVFMAPPRYANGTAKPSGPGDRPVNWGAIDLTKQADRLKGKLLLGYADLDENSYPATTVKMVDALIVANKEFDLIYMPNRPHAFGNESYFVRRRWDFFVRNLAGAQPPQDYRLQAAGPAPL